MARILDDEAAKHNGGITDTVFFHHVKEWGNLESQMNSIKAKMAAAKKQAKDDGVDHADMVHAIKQSKRPLAEQTDQYNRRLSYYRFMRLPIGTHMNFVDDNISDTTGLTDEQREESWKNQGFIAGVNAVNRDTCPHDPNSVAGRIWLQGYDEGQAKNAEGIKKPTVAKVEAAPKEKAARGRKPKAKDEAPAGEEQTAATETAGEAAPNPDDWDNESPRVAPVTATDDFDDNPPSPDA